MKNAFYFTLQALLEKQLDWKNAVNFKTYDVATWETNNCNTILPNMSRNKYIQTMKFGELIEYNMQGLF